MTTFRLILNDEQLTNYFEIGNETFTYNLSKYFPKVISVTLEEWIDESNNVVRLKVVTRENDPATTIEQYISYSTNQKLCQTLKDVIQWTDELVLYNQFRKFNMDPNIITGDLDTFQVIAFMYEELERCYAKGA